MTLKKIVRRYLLLMALQASLAITAAFYVGMQVASMMGLGGDYIAGMWCGISTVVVMQAIMEETRRAAWTRLIGSFFGSLVAGAISTFFGFQPWTLLPAILITVVLMAAMKLHDSFRLACITVLVILGVGLNTPDIPPWENAMARFLESALGAFIAVLFTWLFHPFRKKFDLFNH